MLEQIEMIQKAAGVLAALKQPIAFLGGATICLYLSEIADDDIRPTNDVDCVVDIKTLQEYYSLSEQLRQLGLEECKEGPTCRWKYSDILIDIMPTKADILGFSNPWYEIAIQHVIEYFLPNGQKILIFPLPYLLIFKIEAYKSRSENPYFSHDLEDIVLLLDGCPSLKQAILSADAEVKSYLKAWFKMSYNLFRDYGTAFLPSASRVAGRESVLLDLVAELGNLE